MIQGLPDWIFRVVELVVAGAVVYAGIRSDLARIHAKLDSVSRSADRANARIDSILIR